MTSAGNTDARYVPEPASDFAGADYVYRELLRISAVVDLINEGRFIELRTSAPPRPRDGMLVGADGNHWNPGGMGKGLYEYADGGWNKL